jgi:hypothetical protein
VPDQTPVPEATPVDSRHHNDQSEILEALQSILLRLTKIESNQEKIMALLDNLTAAVTNETTVEQSAITLIAGLAAQIQTLINNSGNTVDPVALQKLVDAMTASQAALAAAVAANTVAPPTPLAITSTSLPAGSTGVAYGPASVAVSGGTPPVTFSATGLPSGLSMDSTGAVSGTPAAGTAGTASVVVTATDSKGATVTATLSLSITVGPAGGRFR